MVPAHGVLPSPRAGCSITAGEYLVFECWDFHPDKHSEQELLRTPYHGKPGKAA
jgi:hypothetical protein